MNLNMASWWCSTIRFSPRSSLPSTGLHLRSLSLATMQATMFLVFLFAFTFTAVSAIQDNVTHNESGAELSKSGDASASMLSKRFDEGNVVVQLVKSLTDLSSNIFKSGFDASVRSLFKKPITSAVYAISMLVGVVAMLAFYESPISPLPVPPLPEPPVGRFPPEFPLYPPGNGQAAPIPAFNPQGNGPARQAASASQQMFHYVPHPNDHKRSDGARLPEPAMFMRPKFSLPAHMNETNYNNYISKLTSSITNNAGQDANNNNKRMNIEYLRQQQQALKSSLSSS